MKLFGSKKKSRHSANHVRESNDEAVRQKKGGSHTKTKASKGRKAVLIALGTVAALLVVIAAGVTIFLKTQVKPPDTSKNLNNPNETQDDPNSGADTKTPTDTEKKDPVDTHYNEQGADTQPPDQEVRPDGVYTVLVAAKDIIGSNTDAIMVARFDTRDYTLNVVSIPRDTLVNVTYRSKLVNAMYAYGKTDGLMDGIEDLVGFRPDFYAVIKLNAIQKLIDAIGGVDYYVPQDMSYDDEAQDLHIHFTKGMTHMNGKKAVEYMRYRKGYSDQDIGRIHAQQDFLATMAQQVLAKRDKINITSLVDIFLNDVTTSLDVGECTWFAKELLKMNAEDVSFATMPGNYNDYYKGRSYVTVKLDEWLEMINDMLNPFNESVTSKNLDVLTRDENNKLIATTGVFADKDWASSSSSKKTSSSSSSKSSSSSSSSSGSGSSSSSGSGSGTTTPSTTGPETQAPPETGDPGTETPEDPPETEDPETGAPETPPEAESPGETSPEGEGAGGSGTPETPPDTGAEIPSGSAPEQDDETRTDTPSGT